MDLHFFDGRMQTAAAAQSDAAEWVFYAAPPERVPDGAGCILPCVCPNGSAHWVSSAFTGGVFRADLRALRESRGGAFFLLLEPLRHRFRPPDRTGVGIPLDAAPEGGVHSEALQCRFTSTLRDGCWEVTLWDTPATLREKLRIAEEAGFAGYLTTADADAG